MFYRHKSVKYKDFLAEGPKPGPSMDVGHAQSDPRKPRVCNYFGITWFFIGQFVGHCIMHIVQFPAGLWLWLQNTTAHCLLPSQTFSTTFLLLPSGKLTLIESPQTIKDPCKSRQTGIGVESSQKIFKRTWSSFLNANSGKLALIESPHYHPSGISRSASRLTQWDHLEGSEQPNWRGMVYVC